MKSAGFLLYSVICPIFANNAMQIITNTIILNMTLIDGKAISEQVKQEIATEVAEIVARGGKRPDRKSVV